MGLVAHVTDEPLPVGDAAALVPQRRTVGLHVLVLLLRLVFFFHLMKKGGEEADVEDERVLNRGFDRGFNRGINRGLESERGLKRERGLERERPREREA